MNMALLPGVRDELSEIAASYPRGATLLPEGTTFAELARAVRGGDDVVHVAGHTERMHGNDDSALLFGTGEAVSGRTVAAASIPKDAVVVLAACETLRRPQSPQHRTLSIGEGFLAAGASDVVGTLAPIADQSAKTLFGEVHRRLAAGADAASAVRDAQLAAIARGDVPPAGWRGVAVLTTRIE